MSLVVLFGGRSAEHDISRISASHVLRAVDPVRYEVTPLGITRDGRWLAAREAALIVADGDNAEFPSALEVAGPEVDPFAALCHRRSQLGEDTPEVMPTVVLPILHGPNGEDGTVQGLLELADLPYVGSGVLGSALAMDKAMAKTTLDSLGIPQPKWRCVHASEVMRAEDAQTELADRLRAELGDTVFIKPANMGSSVGVSKASNTSEIIAALLLACEYDEFVVVEEAVVGRELEVGVLGNLEPRTSVVGEVSPAAEFYDFEDKYSDGEARITVPADINAEQVLELQNLAIRTFKALRAEGMARVDVFFEEGTPEAPGRGFLVNEINTIPGFTPISMYPMLWHHSGLDYPQLIDQLVELAIERHERRSQHRTDVSSRTDTAADEAVT